MRANVNASRLAGVVLSAMVASLSGCASFERHRLSDVSLPTGHPNGKGPVLTYAFSSGMRGQGIGETEHPKRIQRLMEKEFIDALTQSGYSVNTDRGVEGDISLNTRLTNHGNLGGGTLFAAALSGATLTIIPCWVTDGYELKATVVSAGCVQKEYVLDDAMTTAIWLPLIAVYPFKKPDTVGRELRMNMYRHLLLRMQEDGFLPKPGILHQSPSTLHIMFNPRGMVSS